VSFDQDNAGANRSPDQDWVRAEQLLRGEEDFEAQVTGFNRGGVVVAFGQLEGFVPNSHLARIDLRDDGAKAELVGETISLTVLEVDRPNRRLVLSQREAGDQDKEQILTRLEKGQVHTGVVRNLVDFGAFVDLGGVDGLIHISELDWRHVAHPSDVLSVGEEVEVYVLDVDRERSRISLSRKYLLPRPWDEPDESPREPMPRASMVSDQVLRQHRSW
jgi:small subunit ribosomal protein S1